MAFVPNLRKKFELNSSAAKEAWTFVSRMNFSYSVIRMSLENAVDARLQQLLALKNSSWWWSRSCIFECSTLRTSSKTFFWRCSGPLVSGRFVVEYHWTFCDTLADCKMDRVLVRLSHFISSCCVIACAVYLDTWQGTASTFFVKWPIKSTTSNDYFFFFERFFFLFANLWVINSPILNNTFTDNVFQSSATAVCSLSFRLACWKRGKPSMNGALRICRTMQFMDLRRSFLATTVSKVMMVSSNDFWFKQLNDDCYTLEIWCDMGVAENLLLVCANNLCPQK